MLFRSDIFLGDLDDRDSLLRALNGRDILVNVASLGFGHVDCVVSAAEETGVSRLLAFSSTSIFTTLPAGSKAVRTAAEERIASSSLNWTILRPTMIMGHPGDRNIIRLIRWIDRHRIVPVFGPGTYGLQPVYVDDLAVAVVAVLAERRTVRKAYNLSGRTVLDYNGLVALVARELDRSPRVLHLPVGLSLAAVRLAALLPGLPRLSREQVLRLNEDKRFSHEEATRHFGYSPTPLEDVIRREVQLYRERQD